MKQQLLVGGMFLSVLSGISQDQMSTNSLSKEPVNIQNIRSRAGIIKRSTVENAGTALAKTTAPAQLTAVSSATGTWNNIATSMNIYGVFNSNSKPLQYNPSVNAISFIHRKGDNYVAAPANNSGAILAMISQDWGANWDSTCLYSDNTFPGRYPQGAIYSAPGNTNIANAYIVGSGPALDGGNWSGSWYASKQLGAGNYNNTASTAANAMQMLSNTPPYPSFGKHDYSSFHFSSTVDGVVRSIGVICDDFNNPSTDVRGYMIVKGTFNAGTFTWTGDSINPPVILRTDNSHHMNFTPIMAWSEDGTIGYVVSIGARQGATGANAGYQPIIYKTSNSGATWSLLTGIDFNDAQYAPILERINPVENTTNKIPYFWASEGMDATVDASGKLHFVTTIVGTASTDVDQLDGYEVFDTEEYAWPFTPGKMPYIYDFIGDGTGAWSYVTVDSLTSQGPSSSSGNPGYNENPWDADAGFKPRSDARIQLSRTPDGKFVLYTWAESDPNFTAGSKNWNNIPDIKVRAMDVTGLGGSGSYALSPTKHIPSKFGNNTGVISRAMFHYASPVASNYTITGNTFSVNIPLTVSNSNPYSQINSNTHWFANAKLDFLISSVGVAEHVFDNASFGVYPNPGATVANVSLKLSQNRKLSVNVLNALGQQVLLKEVNAFAGENQVMLDVNGLNAGIYFIQVNVDGTNFTKKFIKE
jgi:hypothetical protein